MLYETETFVLQNLSHKFVGHFHFPFRIFHFFHSSLSQYSAIRPEPLLRLHMVLFPFPTNFLHLYYLNAFQTNVSLCSSTISLRFNFESVLILRSLLSVLNQFLLSHHKADCRFILKYYSTI